MKLLVWIVFAALVSKSCRCIVETRYEDTSNKQSFNNTRVQSDSVSMRRTLLNERSLRHPRKPKQVDFVGVVIAARKILLSKIKNLRPDAVAARAVHFFSGLTKVISMDKIRFAIVEDTMRMTLLAKKFSHVIFFGYGNELIEVICERLIFKALRKFRHISFMTIEGHQSVMQPVPENLRVRQVCRNISAIDYSIRLPFSYMKVDMVMVGLQEHLEHMTKVLSKNTAVKYLPVATHTHLRQAERNRTSIVIFLDYDERKIGIKSGLKVLLTGFKMYNETIEEQKRLEALSPDKGFNNSSLLLPLKLFTSVVLPENMRSIVDHVVLERMNHNDFIRFLASVHIYATCIWSSYENIVIEAQTVGAILMSLPGYIRGELYPSNTSIIASKSQDIARELHRVFGPETNYSGFNWAKTNHHWIAARHSPTVVAKQYLKNIGYIKAN